MSNKHGRGNSWERELSNVVKGQAVKRDQIEKAVAKAKPALEAPKRKRPFPWAMAIYGVVGTIAIVGAIWSVTVGAANLQLISKYKKGELVLPEVTVPSITVPPILAPTPTPTPVPMPPAKPKAQKPKTLLQQGGYSKT